METHEEGGKSTPGLLKHAACDLNIEDWRDERNGKGVLLPQNNVSRSWEDWTCTRNHFIWLEHERSGVSWGVDGDHMIEGFEFHTKKCRLFSTELGAVQSFRAEEEPKSCAWGQSLCQWSVWWTQRKDKWYKLGECNNSLGERCWDAVSTVMRRHILLEAKMWI